MHGDGEYTCRICLETDERICLIAPCSCSGSSKWVHRECLDTWRATREDIAFSRCTVCLTPFVIRNRENQGTCIGSLDRYTRFIVLFLKDIALPFLCCVSLILMLTLIFFSIDYKSQYFIRMAAAENHPKVGAFSW
jgi:E3 ubiquitin-protein ligase DOA10